MRYIIGIDLGTTNSCVSYVDTEDPSLAIHPFRIPQLTFASIVDTLPTLPSFCYLPAPKEWPQNALKMPWQKENPNVFVGKFAREEGGKNPTRVIQSAKSWLCHASANRKERILPIEAADPSIRLSPVEATSYYLTQIKNSWNYLVGKGEEALHFEEQEIVLTVPASFDEVARALTVEAAKLAGFAKMTLLEEPQAAFYSWLSYHEKEWNTSRIESTPFKLDFKPVFKPGETILVFDVGGGTTDFSLIEIKAAGDKLAVERRAVGDHLLLGGDNMDRALTHYLEAKIGRELSTQQWLQLCHEARRVKELLLTSKDQDLVERIVIQGSGSHVIAGSFSVEITSQEVLNLLVEGFFSRQSWEESLLLHKARGLRNMGLPYEDDPSITKHLAAFLQQSGCKHMGGPDYILFNGGVMKATPFQEAVFQCLKLWFPHKGVEQLESANLDLAVARGAAYYGKVRRGIGVRIGGGSAKGVYLKVKLAEGEKALTILPRASEEGATYQPETIFHLTPNTPVTFQTYQSHVRFDDEVGSLVSIDEKELFPLPPIHTILRFGKQQISSAPMHKIPVKLEVRYTPLAILELWLLAEQSEHKWKLEFQLKSASGEENSLDALQGARQESTVDLDQLKEGVEVIKEAFTSHLVPPKQVMEKIESVLGQMRHEWSLSTLRALYDELILQAPARKKSCEYEERWWNLAGFFLRPGFGYPFDDHRVKELWKLILADQKAVKSVEVKIQNLICFRRIAGGLTRGQQNQVAAEIIPTIIPKKEGKIEVKNRGEVYAYSEKIRTLGAMELLELSLKKRLGEALVLRIEQKEAIAADFWALGRIGARNLLYGSCAAVLEKEVVAHWIGRLLKIEHEQLPFVLTQLARKSDQRELNLPQDIVEKVALYYAGKEEAIRLKELLYATTEMTRAESGQLFGDHLPPGLELLQRE